MDYVKIGPRIVVYGPFRLTNLIVCSSCLLQCTYHNLILDHYLQMAKCFRKAVPLFHARSVHISNVDHLGHTCFMTVLRFRGHTVWFTIVSLTSEICPGVQNVCAYRLFPLTFPPTNCAFGLECYRFDPLDSCRCHHILSLVLYCLWTTIWVFVCLPLTPAVQRIWAISAVPYNIHQIDSYSFK